MMKNQKFVLLIGAAAVAVFAIGLGEKTGFRTFDSVPNGIARETEKSYGQTSLAAIGGAEAFAGDFVRFGNAKFRVQGVRCPDPSTEQGRDAKALANIFLKITGTMTCKHSNGVGDCIAQTVDGRRTLSEVLRNSGYCK